MRQQILERLKDPATLTPEQKAQRTLARYKKEDEERKQTIAAIKAADTPKGFCELMTKYFKFYLMHTVNLDLRNPKEFNDKFKAYIAQLLTTEAGSRLIIKRNEGFEIHQHTTQIYQQNGKFEFSHFYATPSPYANENKSTNPEEYKAKRVKGSAFGILFLDFPTYRINFTPLDENEHFSLYMEGTASMVAHEEVHNEHYNQGRYMGFLPFRDDAKLTVKDKTFLYSNSEEAQTIALNGFKLTESLISMELRNKPRIFHIGFNLKTTDDVETQKKIIRLSLIMCRILNLYQNLKKNLPPNKMPALREDLSIDFTNCDLSPENIPLYWLFLRTSISFSGAAMHFSSFEQVKPFIDYMLTNKGINANSIYKVCVIHGVIGKLKFLWWKINYKPTTNPAPLPALSLKPQSRIMLTCDDGTTREKTPSANQTFCPTVLAQIAGQEIDWSSSRRVAVTDSKGLTLVVEKESSQAASTKGAPKITCKF